MTAFISKPSDLEIHECGWVQLPSGVWITNLPVIDVQTHLFGRLGWGPAGDWLGDRGWRFPSLGEFDLFHKASLYIAPYTMPTAEMLRAYGIPIDNDDAIDSFRNANMMTREWCQLHDAEVWTRMAAANWDGHPVSNAWWRRDGTKIQKGTSAKPQHSPTFCSYPDTFHAVSPTRLSGSQSPPDTDPAPATSWHDGADLSQMSLAQRCCMWLGYQFGLEPRGGSRLELQTDDSDSPWCAALASATLRCALLPNEMPPHGLRISVRELVEDAREAGTLRPANWTPTFGSLAICARAGQNPLHGGSGHVRCVVGVEGPRYLGIGGNEDDTIKCAWHSLLATEVVGWIER
jgi:hypothetical protein